MSSPASPSPGPAVRLSAGDPDQGPLATGAVTLVLGGEAVDFELTVPAGPVAVEDLLPVFQGLSSLLAQRATARAAAQGRAVSCRAGCGACCRQLVPVAPAEARALARVVEAMPQPRQSQVRARFEAAVATVAEAGLFTTPSAPGEINRTVGLDYFRLGVACPFLVDEACSIHPDRPLSCREYLVTSSPAHCASLSAEGIEKLPLEGDPSMAVLKADLRDGWLPLIHALAFDQSAPPSPRDRTGPQILADVMGRL
ncbi:MAG: YkgJ family cysteine cluster protein [Caulobacter sp.]|nr:YkgJ family cysteine cluster protein [Caulobacter sp.]